MNTITNIKTYHFYNKCRFGDNLMNLRFFKANYRLLKDNNIRIFYYFEPGYNNRQELEKYIDSDITTLKTVYEMPSGSIELWMAHAIDGVSLHDFEKYYILFYNEIYKHLNLPNTTDTMWLDESYLIDRYNELDTKYKDVDILFVNVKATGNRFYPYDELDEITRQLSKTYKVVTLRKIADDIPSTLEAGLTLFDIGAIATHAKHIISIITGPLHTTYNSQTKESVKHWTMIHTYESDYTFYTIDCTFINTNNLEPIKKYYNI